MCVCVCECVDGFVCARVTSVCMTLHTHVVMCVLMLIASYCDFMSLFDLK